MIKGIDIVRRSILLTLSGHGDEIYDICFSPTNSSLLLSSSKDTSVRLWNVQTATCIAIFAGHDGHRGTVMTTSWHCLGKYFISCSMDSTVKMWSLEGGKMKRAISESFLSKSRLSSREGVLHENFPVTFDKVHTNYGQYY